MRYLLYIVVVSALISCGESSDDISTARDRIIADFKRTNIYERGNLPDDPPPTQVSGYYDIISGAYRHISNEYVAGQERVRRRELPVVGDGNLISFFFDAKVYSGSFESSRTFYTNIESRLSSIANDNPEFDPMFWPTDSLVIQVGRDPGILKSVQLALIGCRADDGDPTNDEETGLTSDIVRIYLTPDIGFGSASVYDVPGSSSLVFEITDIQIIE